MARGDGCVSFLHFYYRRVRHHEHSPSSLTSDPLLKSSTPSLLQSIFRALLKVDSTPRVSLPAAFGSTLDISFPS